ncbi:hypothetical protein PsorP6_014830 [Peronosclerospora sorghi]|uniref:Uncharacterized protein n=1 Tax=Peronosclerospora sorghi TaxID=230839 RepID=A0ACC0VSE1_9STRA|nr:hypothetical protein PsorP6_014830 [Peronosclerospora sorghi]
MNTTKLEERAPITSTLDDLSAVLKSLVSDSAVGLERWSWRQNNMKIDEVYELLELKKKPFDLSDPDFLKWVVYVRETVDEPETAIRETLFRERGEMELVKMILATPGTSALRDSLQADLFTYWQSHEVTSPKLAAVLSKEGVTADKMKDFTQEYNKFLTTTLSDRLKRHLGQYDRETTAAKTFYAATLYELHHTPISYEDEQTAPLLLELFQYWRLMGKTDEQLRLELLDGEGKLTDGVLNTYKAFLSKEKVDIADLKQMGRDTQETLEK